MEEELDIKLTPDEACVKISNKLFRKGGKKVATESPSETEGGDDMMEVDSATNSPVKKSPKMDFKEKSTAKSAFAVLMKKAPLKETFETASKDNEVVVIENPETKTESLENGVKQKEKNVVAGNNAFTLLMKNS